MNRKKVILVAFSVAILVLFSASTSLSGQDLWPKKEGELCWTVSSIYSTGTLHLYVMKMGNSNHYVVSGYNDEGDETPLVNGTAIVNDDKIVIHASSSGYSGDDNAPDEIRGTLGTVILDPETLNGSYRGVNINYFMDPGPDELSGSVKYDGVQNLVFIECP